MKESTHTPGPWKRKAYDLGFEVIFGNCEQKGDTLNERKEQFICQGYMGEANARLVAAAPDLLEDLEKMTNEYAKAMSDAGVTRYPETLVVVREARAVITKAKGSEVAV